jgi:hypothetical protein
MSDDQVKKAVEAMFHKKNRHLYKEVYREDGTGYIYERPMGHDSNWRDSFLGLREIETGKLIEYSAISAEYGRMERLPK